MPRDRFTAPPRKSRPAGFLLVMAGLGILFAAMDPAKPALGQNRSQDKARIAVETEIRDRLQGIRQELIKTARETQSNEAVMADSEAKLAALTALHADRARDFSDLRSRLASLTAAMQRLARRPPEAILTSSQPPLDNARAMMLVRFLVPDIKREVDTVREQLSAIETLNQQVQAERDRYQAASLALEERRGQLDKLIERKNALWRGISSPQTPVDQLKESSEALSALLDALKEQGDARADAGDRLRALMASAPTGPAKPHRPAPVVAADAKPPAIEAPRSATVERARPSEQTAVARAAPPSAADATQVPAAGSFAASKGRLTNPAFGRVIGRFGETDELGLTAKGIVVQTRPNAPVVSVHDGKVIYAGPFRGYGRIIIVEHGQGFLTLLAGLDRIDVRAGQALLAGEPVGTMKGPAEIDDVRSRDLYIEVRRNGAPVDPLAWLSTQRDTAIQ